MHSKRLRIAVICWLAWWFGFYIPIHQRGYFQLPGTEVTATIVGDVTIRQSIYAATSCCRRSTAPENQTPAPASSGNCAVCKQAMNTVAPPPIDFGHRPLCLLAILTPQTPHTPALDCAPLPSRGRAPPVTA